MSDVYNFRAFDMNSIHTAYGVALVIGKSQCGKTTFVKDMVVERAEDFYVVHIVHMSHQNNHELEGFFPEAVIYSDLDYDRIQTIHDLAKYRKEQQKIKLQALDRQRDLGLLSPDEYERERSALTQGQATLIYFDDAAMNRTDFANNPVINELFFKGRHSDVFVIMCLQDMKAVPPCLRSNAQLVFAFNSIDEDTVDNLRTIFFSVIPSRSFRPIFDHLTRNYQCIVSDRRECVNANDLYSVVTTYRARYPVPPTQVGHPDLWTTCNEVYNPEWLRARSEMRERMLAARLSGLSELNAPTKPKRGGRRGGGAASAPIIQVLDHYSFQSPTMSQLAQPQLATPQQQHATPQPQLATPQPQLAQPQLAQPQLAQLDAWIAQAAASGLAFDRASALAYLQSATPAVHPAAFLEQYAREAPLRAWLQQVNAARQAQGNPPLTIEAARAMQLQYYASTARG